MATAITTQGRARSVQVAQEAAPQGFPGRVVMLIARPSAFFRTFTRQNQAFLAALLILLVVGLSAANQLQTTAAATAAGTQGFSLSVFDATTSDTTAAASATTTGDSADTSAILTSVLLAVAAVLVGWAGQAVVLNLAPMLRGFRPNFQRGLQVAVWASVPTAIMLLMRQLYFAAGGDGGLTGLSLLLVQWDGYASLGDVPQRILTEFMSNLSLFWLWGVLLLFLGAWRALRGKAWTALLATLMWIAVSTVVPALVSEPTMTTAPRVTATESAQSATRDDATTTTRQQATTGNNAFGGNNAGGGMNGGGGMPSGGPPNGGGFPGG